MKNLFKSIPLIILAFIAGLVIKSCYSSPDPPMNYRQFGNAEFVSIGNSIHIYRIDHCDYVVYSNANGSGITHKANCKNINHDR